MAGSTVTINRLNGKSGRSLPGFYHYSSLVFYGVVPSVVGKWKTYPGPPLVRVQQMFSSADALSAGIIPFSDSVAATASYTIATAGATGNTIEFFASFPMPSGVPKVVSLGVYTVGVTETTEALQATAAANLINSNTSLTGITAAASVDDIIITFPKNYGLGLNGKNILSTSITGAAVVNESQPTGGTASQYAVWYYHIKEHFRIFPEAVLYVSVMPTSSNFDEVQTIQAAAGGKIRQIGVYDKSTARAASSAIMGTLMQLDKAVKRSDGTTPMQSIYSPNTFLVTDWSQYPDQNTNVASKVQCVISQDGDAEGAALFLATGQSIGHIGVKLATMAKSRVSASDAVVIEDFNISDGVENDILAFSNGYLASNVTEGLQNQLDKYRYTFAIKFVGETVGSYWTDNKCCVSNASDYSNTNDNRTMDTITRILRTTLIPKLNTEVFFNADGTLSDFTIVAYEDAIHDAIHNNMVKGYGNFPLISGFNFTIDPTQPVKSTSTLVINGTFNQNGINRNTIVNISY